MDREPFDWQRATPPEYLHLDLQHMEELRRGRAPPPFEKVLIRRGSGELPPRKASP